MTNKEKRMFALKLTEEFTEKCDGMSVKDVVDILHYHYMYCLEELCDCADIDIRQALQTTKVYIDEIIEEMNNKDMLCN